MNQPKSAGFTTTNWSLVLAAMDTAPARATDALGRLCSRYWFPVYAFIRQHGNDVHKAEDLTQSFFEFVIEHRILQRVQRDRGRFRSFILTSLTNFLHNHHARATAAKRGGKAQIVPLDEGDAEKFLAAEPAPVGGLEDSFDRRWAVTLIRRVMENLRAECVKRGRTAVHDALIPHLAGEPERADFERMAAELDMTTGALEVALIRLRRRFGELLRSEVAYTVADAVEVEEEIRYLLFVLSEQ